MRRGEHGFSFLFFVESFDSFGFEALKESLLVADRAREREQASDGVPGSDLVVVAVVSGAKNNTQYICQKENRSTPSGSQKEI